MPNELYLRGSVGEPWWEGPYFTADQVRRDLSAMGPGPVTVYLNSGGGLVEDGLLIFHMLKDRGDVHVVVEGVAMSSASLIAMAGKTITMRAGAMLLVHSPACGSPGRGTAEDHLTAVEHLNSAARGLADIYAWRTGLSVDRCLELMRAETLLNPEEAVALGFATAVEPLGAVAAALHDYRIYATAPAPLRAVALALPHRQEPTMSDHVDPAADEAVTEEITAAATAEPEALDPVVEDETPEPAPVVVEAVDATAITARERTRTTRIMAAAITAGVAMSVATDLIERGVDENAALQTILQTRKDLEMSQHPGAAPVATITADARDKFVAGATLGLMARAGVKGGERNEFTGLTMSELARESLRMQGMNPMGDRETMIRNALTMGGMHTTSDFANVLGSTASRAAMRGYDEAPETYQEWVRIGSVSDFRPASRVALTQIASLPIAPEGSDYAYTTIGDRGEVIQARRYASIVSISPQAVINDDLSLLSSIPTRLGRAARRTVGDLAYAVLLGNPVLADGVALFAAGHGNLQTGAGSALSVTALQAARAAMKVQKEGPATLNISPRFLLVPAALESVAEQLMLSQYEPVANKGHAINPVAGMCKVVSDARLDAASVTAWFLAADPSAYDTVEVVFREGASGPTIDQRVNFASDSVDVKVVLDVGAAPLSHQGLLKANGA